MANEITFTPAEQVERALRVFITNERIVDWLEHNDPKALEQAIRALSAARTERALRAAEQNPVPEEPEEPEADLEEVYCPACGGEGFILGQLGSRLHFRCRNCGIDFSHGGA